MLFGREVWALLLAVALSVFAATAGADLGRVALVGARLGAALECRTGDTEAASWLKGAVNCEKSGTGAVVRTS